MEICVVYRVVFFRWHPSVLAVTRLQPDICISQLNTSIYSYYGTKFDKIIKNHVDRLIFRYSVKMMVLITIYYCLLIHSNFRNKLDNLIPSLTWVITEQISS